RGGGGLLGFGVAAAGLVVAGIGGVFLLSGLLIRSTALRAATAQLASLEQEVNRLKSDADAWAAMQDHAGERLRILGLPDDAARLRETAEAVAIAERNRVDIQRWRTRRSELAEKQFTAAAAFWSSLGSTGNHPPDADVAAEVQRYRDDCRRRWVAAHQAGRRKELEEQLRIRIQLEQTAADAIERGRAADQNLASAAASCGVKGTDLREIAAGLQSWLEQKGKDRER